MYGYHISYVPALHLNPSCSIMTVFFLLIDSYSIPTVFTDFNFQFRSGGLRNSGYKRRSIAIVMQEKSSKYILYLF